MKEEIHMDYREILVGRGTNKARRQGIGYGVWPWSLCRAFGV